MLSYIHHPEQRPGGNLTGNSLLDAMNAQPSELPTLVGTGNVVEFVAAGVEVRKVKL
jgi:hypothetical protein